MPPVPDSYVSRPYRLYNDDLRYRLPLVQQVQSVVTDPPYDLGFMGKKWDKTGIAFQPETWELVLSILPPGGHLLCFGGTRTFHRLTCAIEDAGFEIRDVLCWLYGSGFPKSLDVAKAIDKRRVTNDLVRPWLKSLGSREVIAAVAKVTPRQVDHWLGENTPCPQTLTADRFILLCEEFGIVPSWAEDMYPAIGERIGVTRHARSGGDDFAKVPGSKAQARVVDDVSTATESAKLWDGWGTAIKPAWEPIILARKPLEGTVAQNVLKYGVGALNINRCRVGPNPGYSYPNGPGGTRRHDVGLEPGGRNQPVESTNGRWPANVVHDGSDEVMEEFEKYGNKGGGTGKPIKRGEGSLHIDKGYRMRHTEDNGQSFSDEGSAARFFYCAKASKSDRGEGNTHPCVKPTTLLQWLVRLITPPGGAVCDPFMGSGSTGKACALEGFRFIGMDNDREHGYFEIATRRVREAYGTLATSKLNDRRKSLFE